MFQLPIEEVTAVRTSILLNLLSASWLVVTGDSKGVKFGQGNRVADSGVH